MTTFVAGPVDRSVARAPRIHSTSIDLVECANVGGMHCCSQLNRPLTAPLQFLCDSVKRLVFCSCCGCATRLLLETGDGRCPPMRLYRGYCRVAVKLTGCLPVLHIWIVLPSCISSSSVVPVFPWVLFLFGTLVDLLMWFLPRAPDRDGLLSHLSN